MITTVGSEEKRQASLALGADVAINYRNEDFVEQTQRATNGKGADVIVDLIAGDYVAKNYQAAAMDGRIVQIGTQNGVVKELNLMPLLIKRLTHTGSTLRARSVEDKAQIAADLRQKVWPLLERGALKPQIFKTFPLDQAAEAHALMESSQHIGKIMLTI
ncbi:Quinone oxidoreductase 1 [compost metagenome]